MRREPPGRGRKAARPGLRRRWWRPSRNRRRSPARPKPTTSAAITHGSSRAARSRPAGGRTLRQAARHLLLLAFKTAGIAILVIGAAAAGYHGYRQAAASRYLTVRHIVMTGLKRASRHELLVPTDAARGKPIFRVDKAELAAALRRHPWVKEVEVSRRLPATLRIAIEEHTPRAAVLLGHVYLMGADGKVFKRAEPNEADGLPVITGVSRLDYVNQPKEAHEHFNRALRILARYESKPRPRLGEIHLGADDEITLFLRKGGTALRLGAALTDERLARLDAVWQALGPDSARARAVYLDHELRASRVVVRMRDFD